MGHFGPGKWKNDEQLWWTGAKPGDKLDLALPVEPAGKYEVSVSLTKARDYGIVQFSLDGKKAGEPIDLYNAGVVPTGPISLGTRPDRGRAQADGRDRRRQREGGEVLHVRHRPDRAEAGPVATWAEITSRHGFRSS